MLGCTQYSLNLKKKIYIINCFSTVKKILKTCVTCRRLNKRTIKINQSSYREFRIKIPNIPFKYVFIDHLSHYWTKINNQKRSVDSLYHVPMEQGNKLKVCLDLNVKEFLRTFQLHVFLKGLPELVLSDLRFQITAGANILADLIKDPESQLYLKEMGSLPIQFEQYFKSCHVLRGLVESCQNDQTFNLCIIFIRNLVFNHLTTQTTDQASRYAPVTHKNNLKKRDRSSQRIKHQFISISPENCTRGNNKSTQ